MDSDGAYEFDSDDMMDSDEAVAELSGDDSNDSGIRQENFNVLSETDVHRRQEDDITAVTTVLSISRIEAGILLRYYKWCVSKVHEGWFADEERVRKTVGILKNPFVDISNERTLTCGICFETTPKDEIRAASCGHPFCSVCWAGYISTAIDDGPGCIMLRCPDPSCTAALGQNMIDELVSEDHKKKYARFLVRSYIDDSKKMKWCPAAGCEYAVNFELGGGDCYDVKCSCSYGFCWKCTEETHRPVDCETVAMWIAKNCAESENANWILANTKPCPKCKKSIEKNQGCMHMTCRAPCRFEFCWLCLGAWEAHRGYYACNVYDTGKRRGEFDEAEKRRERAKRSLERYTHFYERWASNHSSRKKAMGDLQRMQNVELKKLIAIQGETEGQTMFIIDAWQQIVECRRVLKWTYAYGYYFPAEQNAKRELFEYLQGEAESGLERLHQCAEKELQEYIEAEGPSEKYTHFRTKLINLTRITKNYFENLVRALENGLPDVNCTDPKFLGEDGPSSSRDVEAAQYGDIDHWVCDRCTYMNPNSQTSCQMCVQNPGFRGR